MEDFAGTITPPGMYVRALYDYDADDRTSLSFRQGEIIQVLTQLESGWWDGIIRGQRGWFPSNYCVLVSAAEARRLDHGLDLEQEEPDTTEAESEDDYEDQEDGGGRYYSVTSPKYLRNGDSERQSHEEAAFWIPQATPDGRLFYFNTLTGESTVELPLESPTSANDTGPRERTNIFSSENARPPPELMMSGGFEKEDDTDFDQSGSEAEEMSKSRGSLPRKRRSYVSDGASPATSLESLSIASPDSRPRTGTGKPSLGGGQEKARSMGKTGGAAGRPSSSLKGVSVATELTFSDTAPVPLTWDQLVEDMRRSVERFRQVVNKNEKAEFVRRAEDISDHLRLLLAAASGTTDNHSGNPSIISTNKALYPHFRDMMSRFSKLVLSSHIAAADWPAGDSSSKCLQEADGVLNGVYGFVEVARHQRGEEIPRLFPGFVGGSQIGGNWQGNGILSDDVTRVIPFAEHTDPDFPSEPKVPLDSTLLERMNDLKRLILGGLRRLEERLTVTDNIISHQKHRKLGNDICLVCSKIIDLYKPWMSAIESINLAPLGKGLETQLLMDFNAHKQNVYNLVSELILNCQTVAAPLADEWAENRGESLEERMRRVQMTTKDLEKETSNINYSLQLLVNEMPATAMSSFQLVDNGQRGYNHKPTGSASSKETGRSVLGDISSAVSYSESTNAVSGLYINSDNAKVKKFFGEVPVTSPTLQSENTPEYLQLDYEGEVQYDRKADPLAIRGGTLTGLVEQLTRHDKYDAPFNNTFLLTYQSFTTGMELFEMLVRRWSIQPPAGLNKEEFQIWAEKKQGPIRFRIVNVLKTWLDFYWMEGTDAAGKDLIQRIYNFARDTVATSSTPGAKPLLLVIEQRMRGEDARAKRLVPNTNSEAPPPILPKNMKKLKFQDIDATEFARQLTIIESKLYGRIKPHECLNKIWQKKNLPQNAEPAANVKSLILHSNRVTNWVAEMILTQTDLKKRVAVIKHFVNVADKCFSMNNFSTLTSIISALGTAPIHRLNRTWSQVSQKTKTILENLRKLMGSTKNFAEYREALHQANPPCIPFFGVYLTDLTFIEDGIPSIIKKTDLINFAKRAKTAEVIREIQTYQNMGYPFKSIPELQNYILEMIQSAGEVHEMYEKSLQVEPREREDEKIARYVHTLMPEKSS